MTDEAKPSSENRHVQTVAHPVTCPLGCDLTMPEWARRSWWEHFDRAHRDEVNADEATAQIGRGTDA